MGLRWNISARSLGFSDFRVPLGVGILYAVLVASTIRFSSIEHSAAVLWPANAVPLAMLMLRPRREWPAIVLTTFVGAIVGTIVIQPFGFSVIPFALANVVEVVLAAGLANFSRDRDGIEGTVHSMVRFVFGAGIAAPAISAIVGAGAFAILFGDNFGKAYLTWFMSDALGILIFTPFFYALFAGGYSRWWRESTAMRRWEAVALVLLTIAISVFVFSAPRPLMFLVIMPTMLVAFRLGWIGVKVAVMIVAVVGTVFTMAGHGPIIMLGGDPRMNGHYLQIFIVAQLLTQWPAAAALGSRDRLMQDLAKSEQSLRVLAARSSVLMLTFDVGGICRSAMGAADLLPGQPVDAMPNLAIEQLVDGNTAALRHAHEMALDMPETTHSAEFRIWSGDERWLEATFRALEDEGGRCPGTLMTLHDISTRKAHTMALALSAHTDSLTGLLNRAGFLARLDQALAGGGREGLVLAMIDVDRFKLINDNHGHQAGDVVLEEIALRISAQLRMSDSVGRMGGDEFVVLLDNIDWDSAQDICWRLVDAVSSVPVRIASGRTIGAAISCGVARYRPGMSADHFLHDADVALYEAKRGGRNQMAAA